MVWRPTKAGEIMDGWMDGWPLVGGGCGKCETVETDLPWYRNGSDFPGLAKATLAATEQAWRCWVTTGRYY